MQTNYCNWSFGTASAFHNITEESIPNNSHKLPTCCALICWVSVCGCGKDNVTYGKSVICVRKKSVCYLLIIVDTNVQSYVACVMFSEISVSSSLWHVVQEGVSVIPILNSWFPKSVLPSFNLESMSAVSLQMYFDCRFIIDCFT